MRLSLRHLAPLAATALLAAACSVDHASLSAPSAASTGALAAPTVGPSLDLSALGGSLTLVEGLQRSTPLARNITVSAVIGADGGTLAIPEAGVVVEVPKKALKGPTAISMTARKGALVAYDFAPHGITFGKSLTITQDLHGTKATILEALTGFQLGYYSDPSLLGTTTALVSELTNAKVDLKHWEFSAPIKHFSGYIASCRAE